MSVDSYDCTKKSNTFTCQLTRVQERCLRTQLKEQTWKAYAILIPTSIPPNKKMENMFKF